MNFTLVSVVGWWLAGLALAVPGKAAPANDTGAATALPLLRLEFESSLLENCLGPIKKQITELATLEKQRADSRDYIGAIEARDARKRLENELERLDKELLLLQSREQSLHASALPDKIELSLDSAILNGVTRANGEITDWSKPGASAVWMLPQLPPGGYEVTLRFRCGPLEGGSVMVQEKRFSLQGDINTTLKGPEDLMLGTLKITDGNATLTVSARTVVKDNLMRLLGVQLTPASR